MIGLRAVDGATLSEEHRALLRPGDASGLPRFFYEVPSWSRAIELKLTEHFKLAELMTVDCREADLLLREFPHYVPCAITVLAQFLELFRHEVNAIVLVSANGGYRSPAHRANHGTSVHSWGTAADIHRVGDTLLNDEKSIEKYRKLAEGLGADVFVRPYAKGDDHLHVDLGFVTVTPR